MVGRRVRELILKLSLHSKNPVSPKVMCFLVLNSCTDGESGLTKRSQAPLNSDSEFHYNVWGDYCLRSSQARDK